MYLFVINSLGFGGAETTLVRTLRYFESKNIRFLLLVQRKLPDEIDVSDFAHRIIYLSKSSFSFLALFDNLLKLFFLPQFISAFNTKSITLVISYLPQSIIFGYFLSKKLKCELIPVEQNNIVLSLKRGLQNRIFYYLLSRIYKGVERAIISSKEIEDQLFSVYGYTGKCFYIPNCIETDYDSPDIEKGVNFLSIMMVGRLVPQKNYRFAMSLFKQMKLLGLDFKVDIYGTGPEEGDLKNYIEKNDLIDQVTFCGLSNEIHRIFKNYSVFIHTASFEGFGNVLIEAMHAKLLVIASDVDYGPREIISSGENGFLLPLILDHWTDFLKNVDISSAEMKSIRWNAYKRSQDFSSKRVGEMYLAVLS